MKTMKTEYDAEELRAAGIRVVDDDIVHICSALYVKTPEALARLTEDLKAIGYEVKDCRHDKRREQEGHSVDEQEKNGWSLWYASMPDIRFGKCGSCGKLVKVNGIRCHGRMCEHCGAVLYREIVDGSTFKFRFTAKDYVMFEHQPAMKARRWDNDVGFLYLYRGVDATYIGDEFDGGNLKREKRYHVEVHSDPSMVYVFSANGKRHEVNAVSFEERDIRKLRENEMAIAAYPDAWEAVEEDGHQLMKVSHKKPWNRDAAIIECCDCFGHEFNSSIVKVWQGKEYGEWDNLPIPESFSIYEAWHWGIKWPRSPRLHANVMSAAGQVSRQDYYHQDGRDAFWGVAFDRMERFIDHFTEIPVGEFKAALPRMRKDGPGFIEDFGAFCAGEQIPEIENHPNMWNTISAVCDMVGGKPISERQAAAALHGMNDPNMKRFYERQA